jgi:hypothetical protein
VKLEKITKNAEDILLADYLDSRAKFNLAYFYSLKIIRSTAYITGIAISIVLNTVVLGMDRYPIDPEEQAWFEIANNIFLAIFFFEFITKILGLGR